MAPLSAQSDRIVQVAVRQLDRNVNTQLASHSLVNPGREPGPTRIHGIISKILVGCAQFRPLSHRSSGGLFLAVF